MVTAYTLGSLAPESFEGYFDEDRGEVFAYCWSSGETVYGVGADGDIENVDYRCVMWVPAGEEESLVRGPCIQEGYVEPFEDEENAILLLQSISRRALSWMRAVQLAQSQFVKRWDDESGFYFYENIEKGTTQWHRPAVLLGTRRRRGLLPASDDVPDDTQQMHFEMNPEYDGQSYFQDDESKFAECLSTAKSPILSGPYIARCGRGKIPRFAINALKPRPRASGPPGTDPNTPLIIETKDIDARNWQCGQRVQCLDGYKVKQVCVEPYMLARGAADCGPAAIIRLMINHRDRIDTQYFCLMSIAKIDFKENDEGHVTAEARACVLQTLKTFAKHADEQAIVAASLAALIQLADNYASRNVIVKEAWTHLVISAVNNLEFKTQHVLIRTESGEQQSIEVRNATARSCEIASNACRLFAAMACDPQLREMFADDAIRACMTVMRDCADDIIVQTDACVCIYNFVFRCELASVIAQEARVIGLVEVALSNFTIESDFIAVAERTREVLLPNGWRGPRSSSVNRRTVTQST